MERLSNAKKIQNRSPDAPTGTKHSSWVLTYEERGKEPLKNSHSRKRDGALPITNRDTQHARNEERETTYDDVVEVGLRLGKGRGWERKTKPTKRLFKEGKRKNVSAHPPTKGRGPRRVAVLGSIS